MIVTDHLSRTRRSNVNGDQKTKSHAVHRMKSPLLEFISIPAINSARKYMDETGSREKKKLEKKQTLSFLSDRTSVSKLPSLPSSTFWNMRKQQKLYTKLKFPIPTSVVVGRVNAEAGKREKPNDKCIMALGKPREKKVYLIVCRFFCLRN